MLEMLRLLSLRLESLEERIKELAATIRRLEEVLKPPEAPAPGVPTAQPVMIVSDISLFRYGGGELANGGNLSESVEFRSDRNVAIVTARVEYLGTPSKGLRVYWLYGVDSQNIDSVEESLSEGRYTDLGIASPTQRTVLIPLAAPLTMVYFKNDTNVNAKLKYWIYLARI